MSEIRLKSISIKNYRSFASEQTFLFPDRTYLKPISIVGYNNSGKTNLMNAIRMGIGDKYVASNTFEISDLHNLDIQNQITIKSEIEASDYYAGDFRGQPQYKSLKGPHTISTILNDGEIDAKAEPTFFGANKHYCIFYINFHKIKEEISTKKTSWGNLTSFLAKHIKSIVDGDSAMNAKKPTFERETKTSTEKVLKDSDLNKFIDKVKSNYSTNLRGNNCNVEFGLPNYEEIFLQMIFKIGLNGNNDNLVSLEHFGDGYISMFVMAVIQAIAESNTGDKCLFLFEEPESFLHENHQEYFYKMVLCSLAEQGHQVVYTTHSDKMIDIFDTKSIIRIDYDENSKSTIKKYNDISDPKILGTPVISYKNFNSFIKSAEPNLNKILFSRKVLLVEGPNDLLSYNFAIEKKVNDVMADLKYAQSHLNFNNIAIAVHHGKSTALLLVQLCKHFGLDYFVINDWDFEEEFINELAILNTEEELTATNRYLQDGGSPRTPTSKGMINVNWQLVKSTTDDRIHFNIPKLEAVIGYGSDDKSSIGIWNHLNKQTAFDTSFFPQKLINFLEISTLTPKTTHSSDQTTSVIPKVAPPIAIVDDEDDFNLF